MLDLPQTTNTLENFGGSLCNGGSQTVSMAEAFQESCNVTFAEIGLDLGAKEMSEQARAYGFCPTDPPERTTCEEPTIPFVLPWANGRFPVPSYFADRQPQLAFSAIGLDNVLTNPLHMALISAAIANDGVMMRPRLITEVRDPTGKVVREFEPEQYGQPISDATREGDAGDDALGDPGRHRVERVRRVPDRGRGQDRNRHQRRGPCPRTHGSRRSHRPGQSDDARIAVAVIVLDGGNLGNEATGGQVSAPIARAVIDAYL